jgi:glucosamine--fructose-6-phosphate aminotransferase (isomerizing)
MCGIVGYVGPQDAVEVIVDGLHRLEYRGYDSAGLAVTGPAGLQIRRRAGKLAELDKLLAEQPISGHLGVGHTRWATHGAPTDRNAHPHVDCTGAIAVVHNGIIENFAALGAGLQERGHRLASDTDTEVVAHLLEERFTGDLAAAVGSVCADLQGAFSLAVVHREVPDVVVGARRHSPLVVGRGSGENFLASDVGAFIAHTRDALEVGDGQIVEVRPDSVTLTEPDGTPAEPRAYRVDWDATAAAKGGHRFFMLKEITEQPAAVADTVRGRLDEDGQIRFDELRLDDQDLRDVDKVFIVACGSAFYAGLVAKYAIEHWARIPCEVEIASEFRYRDPVLDRQTLVVAVSQSGETLDTLMAVQHAREQQARVLAICNTVGATIPRASDAVLYTRAGPEIGVAATKTFLAQIAATYLVGLSLARVKGTLFGDEVAGWVAELRRIPGLLEQVLGGLDPVRALAHELVGAPAVLFLGRHVGYPVALEGALKLKELAYMHAEAFPAGELKHGPIALVERGLPVVVVLPSGHGRAALHGKVLSNIQEVRARGARVIAVAEEGDEAVARYAEQVIRVPATPTLLSPLVATVPLQVFAATVAEARGLDVDQPRNLAKSVTVE